MMAEEIRISLSEDPNRGSAQAAIFGLRQGHDVRFEMYSDEFMRAYLSDEDYAFWIKKKAEYEAGKRKTA